jgi:colanic acid/amylovoran biosynthesis glycosyltransferase
MRDCDCLALPSVTAADGDQEGIPVTLMEAMACGLPVVSTYHSGIPELVTDGETGLLVPERDVAALAGAIERLMTEEGLARRLADRARRFVAAEFNADIQNPALFDLILGGLR